MSKNMMLMVDPWWVLVCFLVGCVITAAIMFHGCVQKHNAKSETVVQRDGIYEFFSSEDPNYLEFVGNHVRARIDEKEHAIHIVKGLDAPASLVLKLTSATCVYSNPNRTCTAWKAGEVGPWPGDATWEPPDPYVTRSEALKIVDEEITKRIGKPSTESTELLRIAEKLYGIGTK